MLGLNEGDKEEEIEGLILTDGETLGDILGLIEGEVEPPAV